MDYKDKRWQRKREHVLRLDGYQCQTCKMYGRIREANTVHHIYSAREYPEYRFADWNLISVCPMCHNKIENRATRQLTAFGEQLKKMTKIGVGIRKK